MKLSFVSFHELISIFCQFLKRCFHCFGGTNIRGDIVLFWILFPLIVFFKKLRHSSFLWCNDVSFNWNKNVVIGESDHKYECFKLWTLTHYFIKGGMWCLRATTSISKNSFHYVQDYERTPLFSDQTLAFISWIITPFLNYESVLQCMTMYFGGTDFRALVLVKAVYNEMFWSIPECFIDTTLTLNRYDSL